MAKAAKNAKKHSNAKKNTATKQEVEPVATVTGYSPLVEKMIILVGDNTEKKVVETNYTTRNIAKSLKMNVLKVNANFRKPRMDGVFDSKKYQVLDENEKIIETGAHIRLTTMGWKLYDKLQNEIDEPEEEIEEEVVKPSKKSKKSKKEEKKAETPKKGGKKSKKQPEPEPEPEEDEDEDEDVEEVDVEEIEEEEDDVDEENEEEEEDEDEEEEETETVDKTTGLTLSEIDLIQKGEVESEYSAADLKKARKRINAANRRGNSKK